MSSIDLGTIKDKAKDLAQTGVAKAKELTDTAIEKGKQLAEIAKLKLQNNSERESAKKCYLALGKLYYAEHGAAPDAPYADLCEKVTASLSKIDYNNERIADIKAAGHLSDEEVENAATDAGEDHGDHSSEE